jgi:zinc protease
LTVILHEDHKTPLVAMNLQYRVGSRDEGPGKTGLAHLFEHFGAGWRGRRLSTAPAVDAR